MRSRLPLNSYVMAHVRFVAQVTLIASMTMGIRTVIAVKRTHPANMYTIHRFLYMSLHQ